MEWFQSWFDTPYYHILYQHRDEQEAKKFIVNICKFLQFKNGDKVWDLCCGKGRHSLELRNLNLEVVGTDLSQQSIQFANQFKKEGLQFFVHDMRDSFRENQFDAVLNLFTSFGYFDTVEENQRVIESVYKSLKSGGQFLIDFLNVDYVIQNLIETEVRILGGIEFNIRRQISDNYVVKTIRFFAEEKEFEFQEKVNLLDKEYFVTTLSKSGFQDLTFFGDYDFNEFNPKTSPRLIIACKK